MNLPVNAVVVVVGLWISIQSEASPSLSTKAVSLMARISVMVKLWARARRGAETMTSARKRKRRVARPIETQNRAREFIIWKHPHAMRPPSGRKAIFDEHRGRARLKWVRNQIG